MSRIAVTLFLVVSFGLSGCQSTGNWSMMNPGNWYQSAKKTHEKHEDDWEFVGSEGRAEIPRQKETDGLTPILQSPEARAIERNLGYD